MKHTNALFVISIFISLLLTSCGSSKLFEEPQKVFLQPGAVASLEDGQYIQVIIDSTHSLRLKFDTGATASFVYDVQAIGGKTVFNKHNYAEQEVQDATRSFSSILYQSKSFDSNVSKSTHQVIVVLKSPRKSTFQCFAGLFAYDGLYGLDAFSEAQNPHPVLLNYKKNTIKVLKANTTIPPTYQKVNAYFGSNSIYLKGSINGEEMYFLFDTGHNGYILLQNNVFADNKNITPEDMGNGMFSTVSSILTPSKSLYFQNVEVSIEGLPIDETLITVMEKVNNNAVGFGFIENYNWIIDFEHEQLYAKKINNFNSDNFFDILSETQNFAAAVNGRLVILYSNEGNPYQLGDVIVSVKGKKITDKNICEMQRLLLKNRESWEKLNVVVK